MTQKTLTSVDKLRETITRLHIVALAKAKDAVNAAIQCGTVLVSARNQIGDGGWGEFLSSLNMSRTTAFRYMTLAQKVGTRTHQLTDGITLVDLYREFGLIQATTGGGRRLGESELQRRKFDVRYQMTHHWSDVANWLEKIDKAVEEQFNPFAQEELEVDLDATERHLEAALGLVRDAKSQRSAVDVAATAETTEA